MAMHVRERNPAGKRRRDREDPVPPAGRRDQALLRDLAYERLTEAARAPDSDAGARAAAEEKRLLQARRAIARAIGALAPTTRGERAVNVPAYVCREAEALLRDYAEHLVERRLRSPALIARVQEAGL